MSESVQDKSKPFNIEWAYYQQLLGTIEELRKDLKYFTEVDDINERLMTRCEQLKNELDEMKEAPCAFCGH